MQINTFKRSLVLKVLERGLQKKGMPMYSSNYITKKETKSEAHVAKFDWHDLSPIFLSTMLLHNLKVF